MVKKEKIYLQSVGGQRKIETERETDYEKSKEKHFSEKKICVFKEKYHHPMAFHNSAAKN